MCFLCRMDSVLTISQVSRRSGVASSALRFYEERGLIASQRAGSGHRRYPRSVLRRIAFIVFALGILGTGLLAVPVLAGSSAYALAGDLVEISPDASSVVIVKHNNPCGVASIPRLTPESISCRVPPSAAASDARLARQKRSQQAISRPALAKLLPRTACHVRAAASG